MDSFANAFSYDNNFTPCDCISFTFQEIEKYKLDHPKTFHYLNQSKCHELVGVSDAHDYLATRRAMDIVGISKAEQVCLM